MKRHSSARLLRGQVVVGWMFFHHCMKLLGKVRREFSGYSILESGKRLLDRKPLQCSLYVTDRCNLDCAYCTEYDNSRPHPSLDDLKKWIRKIRELGTMRIALVGGEPLVHADPWPRFRVDRGRREELERFIDSMIERKRRGEKIHTSEAILNYQRSLLRGEHVEWTCMAGYKLFFVSAQGKFWICSMVHTDKHIMDVTLDDLYANYRKKSCQKGCGVYCAVSASLLVEKPAQVLGKEIVARAKRIPSTVRRSLTSNTDKATHGTITNPDGPRQMNGSTKSSPSADDGVTLREGV